MGVAKGRRRRPRQATPQAQPTQSPMRKTSRSQRCVSRASTERSAHTVEQRPATQPTHRSAGLRLSRTRAAMRVCSVGCGPARLGKGRGRGRGRGAAYSAGFFLHTPHASFEADDRGNRGCALTLPGTVSQLPCRQPITRQFNTTGCWAYGGRSNCAICRNELTDPCAFRCFSMLSLPVFEPRQPHLLRVPPVELHLGVLLGAGRAPWRTLARGEPFGAIGRASALPRLVVHGIALPCPAPPTQPTLLCSAVCCVFEVARSERAHEPARAGKRQPLDTPVCVVGWGGRRVCYVCACCRALFASPGIECQANLDSAMAEECTVASGGCNVSRALLAI